MICCEDALSIELAKREQRAAHLKYFVQARVLGVEFGRHVTIARVLQDTNQAARLIGTLDYVLVIARLRALMSVPDDFARDSVGPLQVLCELRREGAQVARGLGQRPAKVDRQSHLSSEREAVWREARRL